MADINDLRKAMENAQRMAANLPPMPALKEAVRQTEAARAILSQSETAARVPGLSEDALRWQAEKAAAPVHTRNAVYALADAVEALTRSSERTSRQMVGLTVALVILTVMIVVLTALLVTSG